MPLAADFATSTSAPSRIANRPRSPTVLLCVPCRSILLLQHILKATPVEVVAKGFPNGVGVYGTFLCQFNLHCNVSESYWLFDGRGSLSGTGGVGQREWVEPWIEAVTTPYPRW